MYHIPLWNVVELRKRLVETSTKFQQSNVNESIEQWHNRLTDSIVVFAQTKVTSDTYSNIKSLTAAL